MKNDVMDKCAECGRLYWKYGRMMTCSIRCNSDRLRRMRNESSAKRYKYKVAKLSK